ncbi:response regulator [Streptomyces sp. NRRL S-337]|uniref:response regulator n=1 Tax=Streptomyces sp. NRRL S-337 TaxID=1463900 RepID=UPI0005617752|nr:response regulator transcription factor [Streptomyces sp. NRRL S-337]
MTSSATSSTGEAPHTPVRVLLCDDHAVVRAGLLALLSSAPGIEVIAEAGDGEEAVALAAALRPDVVLMDLQLGSGIDGIEATRRITAHAREHAKGGNTVGVSGARETPGTDNPAGATSAAHTPPAARPTKTAPAGTGPARSTSPAGTSPTSPTGPARSTSSAHPTVPIPHVLVLTTYDTDADITRAIDAGATGYLLKAERPEELFAAIRAAATGRSTLSGPVAHRVLAQMRSPRPTLTDRELDILGQLARGLSNREIARALFISEATVKTHLGRIYDKLSVDTRAGAVSVAKEQRLLP